MKPPSPIDHNKTPCRACLGTRRAELHEQLFARELHALDLLEPCPKPPELAPAYRALLRYAIGALSQHIELAVLRQQLHLHARPRLVPGLVQQLLLEFVEAALRR